MARDEREHRRIRIPRAQRLSVCRCGGICRDYPRCRHESDDPVPDQPDRDRERPPG